MSVTATNDVGQYQGPSRRVTSAEEMASRARALRRAAAAERSRRHRRGRLHRPSPLRVELAIPRGHVRADGIASWLDDVQQHPDFVARRGDAQENILAVAKAIAAYARWDSPDPDAADSWQRMTSRPGWEMLKARTGFSRSTVANHILFLRRAGLLGIVATGTTADLSPGVLVTADTTNAAAVYVLMRPEALRAVAVARPDDVGAEFIEGPARWTPSAVYELDEDDDVSAEPSSRPLLSVIESVDRSWTPSRSPTERSNPAYARARRKASGAGLRPALKTSSPMRNAPRSTAAGEPWPLSRRPTRRDEMLTAAAAIQRALPVLSRISAEHLRSITRPLHLAGWTPADVLHAIARRPDGSVWHHGHDVRDVVGWLRHRLAPWHAEGLPRAPRSQQLAADATLARAERRAAAEREATARSAAVPSPADPSWTAAKAAVKAQAAALRAARRAGFLPPNA